MRSYTNEAVKAAPISPFLLPPNNFTADFKNHCVLALFSIPELARLIFSFLNDQKTFKNLTLTSRLFAVYRNPAMCFLDPKDKERFCEKRVYKTTGLHSIDLGNHHFLAISMDEKRAISAECLSTAHCDSQKIFMVWDTHTGVCLKEVFYDEKGVCNIHCATFSPDGKKIGVITSGDYSLRFYDGDTYRFLGKIQPNAIQSYEIYSCEFSLNGQKFVTKASRVKCDLFTSEFIVWDANTCRPLIHCKPGNSVLHSRVMFNLDSTRIIVSENGRGPRLFFDSETGESLAEMNAQNSGGGWLIGLLNDGADVRFVYKHCAGVVDICNIESNKTIKTLQGSPPSFFHLNTNKISVYSSGQSRSVTQFIFGADFMGSPSKEIQKPTETKSLGMF